VGGGRSKYAVGEDGKWAAAFVAGIIALLLNRDSLLCTFVAFRVVVSSTVCVFLKPEFPDGGFFAQSARDVRLKVFLW